MGAVCGGRSGGGGAGAAAVSADGHYAEFLEAIRGEGVVYSDTNSRCFSDVDASIPIMESVLVGVMSQRVPGRLVWNSKRQTFDNAEAKAMLVNTVLETLPSKYLVAASGMAGFDCGNSIRTRKITDKFYVSGDGVSDVNGGIGLVAPRVMLCAAHQAHTVLRILAEQFET